MSLVGHIPLSERNHILEMVRQEFPAYVDPLDVLPDNLPILDWNDMTERIPYIEHDTTCRWDVAFVAEESAIRDQRGSYLIERDRITLRKGHSRVFLK